MSSIFTINQRYNNLLSQLNGLIETVKNKTLNSVIIPLSITNNKLTIDFKKVANQSYHLNMDQDITSFSFKNPVVNGFYTVYLYVDLDDHIILKSLGLNILNNLLGDSQFQSNHVFSISIFYDGNNYILNFQSFS